MSTFAIGIDFGTTNSSIARANGVGEIELARFSPASDFTDAYLSAETKGRLIQSLKSFLTSRSLKSTDVFGRRMTIEDLIARILRDLREKSEAQFGMTVKTPEAGRPVRFVGTDKEQDNSFAEERLRAAFHLAGYEHVAFELEPVAAAHYYESTLDHDELILIGDFGGQQRRRTRRRRL
jgi:hypothetical chaperone protein